MSDPVAPKSKKEAKKSKKKSAAADEDAMLNAAIRKAEEARSQLDSSLEDEANNLFPIQPQPGFSKEWKTQTSQQDHALIRRNE